MSEQSKPSELDWQHIESRYEDAGLMLFEKRIDKLRNPRNDKVFERLVLESVDWVIAHLLLSHKFHGDGFTFTQVLGLCLVDTLCKPVMA